MLINVVENVERSLLDSVYVAATRCAQLLIIRGFAVEEEVTGGKSMQSKFVCFRPATV